LVIISVAWIKISDGMSCLIDPSVVQ